MSSSNTLNLDRLLAAAARFDGPITLRELRYQTGLPLDELLDTIADAEEAGHLIACSWTTPDSFARTLKHTAAMTRFHTLAEQAQAEHHAARDATPRESPP